MIAAPAPPSGGRATAAGPSRLANSATVVCVLVTAALAALSGLSVGGSKVAVVLPVAAGFGLVMVVLAFTRFRAFVLAALAVRASMDLAKLSTGPGAGVSRVLDPASLLAVLFLLAAGLWLVAQHLAGERLPGSWPRRALLAFAAAGALSVLGSTRPAVAGLETLRVVTAVVMFLVVERLVTDHAALRQVLVAVFASTLFPLLYTAGGFAAGGGVTEVKGGLSRLTGTFNQSNSFGRYLMLMVVFGVAIWPYVGRGWRLVLAAVVAACSGELLFTYTRTALIGTVLGLLVVGAVRSRRLLFGLLAAILCALVLVPQLGSRFTDLGAERGPGSGESNSLAWRLDYWSEVLPLANTNPVTGIGLANTVYETDQARLPHNDFVRAYVETGVIGLAAFLAMLAGLAWLGLRAVRVAPEGTLDHGVGAGFLGCAVAFAAVSLAANVVSNVVVLWYLFAFAAAAAAVVRLRQPAPVPRPTAAAAAAALAPARSIRRRPAAAVLLRLAAVALVLALLALALATRPRAAGDRRAAADHPATILTIARRAHEV